MPQKIATHKIVLGIITIVLIGLLAYGGIVLYFTVKATATLSDTTITTSDISPYLSGIVEITCQNIDGTYSGSGSLWNLPNLGYTVLTNEHVLEDNHLTTKDNQGVPTGLEDQLTIKNACSVSLDGDQSDDYYLPIGSKYQWNKEADEADLPIQFNTGGYAPSSFTPPVRDLNYSISNLRLCPATIPVGAPVAVIGFPDYAIASTTTYADGVSSTQEQDYEITTTGMISGLITNNLDTGAALPYPNFFTTAILDAGNSGGIALSKDSNGLCVLGIPTLVIQGEYSSEGVVQNIRNIFSPEGAIRF
jgi:hypothetical protein